MTLQSAAIPLAKCRRHVRIAGQFFLAANMIEELKDEELVRKLGGRFKLSALIQKRLVALNKGARSSVSGERNQGSSRDKLSVVIQEILNDKIYLEAGKKVPTHLDSVDEVLDNEFSE
jgi:DNA-directed RNA polymerase subunit omega